MMQSNTFSVHVNLILYTLCKSAMEIDSFSETLTNCVFLPYQTDPQHENQAMCSEKCICIKRSQPLTKVLVLEYVHTNITTRQQII